MYIRGPYRAQARHKMWIGDRESPIRPCADAHPRTFVQSQWTNRKAILQLRVGPGYLAKSVHFLTKEGLVPPLQRNATYGSSTAWRWSPAGMTRAQLIDDLPVNGPHDFLSGPHARRRRSGDRDDVLIPDDAAPGRTAGVLKIAPRTGHVLGVDIGRQRVRSPGGSLEDDPQRRKGALVDVHGSPCSSSRRS